MSLKDRLTVLWPIFFLCKALCIQLVNSLSYTSGHNICKRWGTKHLLLELWISSKALAHFAQNSINCLRSGFKG